MFDKMASSMVFKYNFALVARIANSFKDSSSFPMKSGCAPIDVDKARHQHEELVDKLRRLQLDVIELPCDDLHPDGLFVDDIAVVINGTALICNPPSNPGNKERHSRQGELAVVRQVLRKELGLKIVELDADKAMLEGGDVLWTGREIFVGISERTNIAGANAVAKAFPEYPTTHVKVYKPAIHLKDSISMAGPEVMVVSRTEHSKKTFEEIKQKGGRGYQHILVDEDDGANVLFCNNTLMHLSSEQIPKSVGVYENKISSPRVAVSLEEPLKRGGKLGSCVLLVARVRHPKGVPTTTGSLDPH